MYTHGDRTIIDLYLYHLQIKAFPCIAAHDAAKKSNVHCFVADHMACPKDDIDILEFLYKVIDAYRHRPAGYLSAAVIFKKPDITSEQMFDDLLWQRLQAIADLDAASYAYDPRVSSDISSPQFSFSLKQEAFYIIGLHPLSSRKARQFNYPVLVFNPHAQFQQLRESDQYKKMQQIVRSRDTVYSGSVNPMLSDFGASSEAMQYSGRIYDETWKCPFKNKS